MNKQNTVRIGDYYKHFTGQYCEVVGCWESPESKKQYVIIKALRCDVPDKRKFDVVELETFLAEVPKQYADLGVKQKNTYVRVDRVGADFLENYTTEELVDELSIRPDNPYADKIVGEILSIVYTCGTMNTVSSDGSVSVNPFVRFTTYDEALDWFMKNPRYAGGNAIIAKEVVSVALNTKEIAKNTKIK